MCNPTRWRWALLAATVFAVSACSAAEQRAADDFETRIEESLGEGAELEIDVASESYRVEVDGADLSEGRDLERPEWLAAEIPLPEDLEITSILVIETFQILRGTTSRSAEELAEFYRSAFEAAAYELEQDWDASAPIAMKARSPAGDPITLEYSDDEFVLVVGRE
jgi:hypothetical protein